jgi:hypothetical protein
MPSLPALLYIIGMGDASQVWIGGLLCFIRIIPRLSYSSKSLVFPLHLASPFRDGLMLGLLFYLWFY